MAMTNDIKLALAKGKTQGARKLLEEYYLQEDKSQWLVDKQAEYDSLFKTKEVVISATTDNDEVVEEQVIYEYIDGCISFNDWLQEEVIIQEAIEPTYDEEGNILTEGQQEVRELVRPYVPSGVTSLVDSYINKQYTELRKAEYLPIEEQLDMMYKDSINGTTNWIQHIESVKIKYPKIEE